MDNWRSNVVQNSLNYIHYTYLLWTLVIITIRLMIDMIVYYICYCSCSCRPLYSRVIIVSTTITLMNSKELSNHHRYLQLICINGRSFSFYYNLPWQMYLTLLFIHSSTISWGGGLIGEHSSASVEHFNILLRSRSLITRSTRAPSYFNRLECDYWTLVGEFNHHTE